MSRPASPPWPAAVALAAALACAGARPPAPAPFPAAASAERDLEEAERLYAERRLAEAREVLGRVAVRADVPAPLRVRALVDAGVVDLEAGDAAAAERTLREALRLDREAQPDGSGERHYPAKALFYLGEVARGRFEALPLDPGTGDEAAMTDRLEEKSTRLLTAQERYLEAVRGGDPRWGVAAGARIGGMYERLHRDVLAAPPPAGLGAAGDRAYRIALRDRVQVLLARAADAYEGTLEAARRHGVEGEFVEQARAGLERTRREIADARSGS